MSDTPYQFSQPVFRSRFPRAGRSACSRSGRLAIFVLAAIAACQLLIFADGISRSKPSLRCDDTKKCARRPVRGITFQDSPGVGLCTSARNRFCEPSDRHPSGIPIPAHLQGDHFQQASGCSGSSRFHRSNQALESAETRRQDRDCGKHTAQNQTLARAAINLAAKTPVRCKPVAAGLNGGFKAHFSRPKGGVS